MIYFTQALFRDLFGVYFVVFWAGMRGEAVYHTLQPAAHGLLGEGVDNQSDGCRRKGSLCRIPQRQKLRQERQGQAVQFQRQRDETRINKGYTDNDADAEQVGRVFETILCIHCGGERLRRDGFAPNGKQRYFCNACKKGSRQTPKSLGYSAEFRVQVLAAYHERATLRGVCRIFGICRPTLVTWLKKPRD